MDEFNAKYGAKFLKELDDLYNLYKANERRLNQALALAKIYKTRIQAIAEGRLKIP